MCVPIFKCVKSAVVVVVFLLFCGTSLAQENRTIDSLQNLSRSATGLTKFDLLYDISFEYIFKGDFVKALETIEQAQGVASDTGDSLRIVKSGRVRAQVLRRAGRLNDAINQFADILPIAKRNNFEAEIKYALNGLGIAYTLQSDYDKALDYHFESLVAREKEGDDGGIYETLNNIGLVYFKLKDYERALNYYFRALEYGVKIKDTKFMPRQLINIGLCYNQIGNFSEAQKYINQGMASCDPNCDALTRIEGEFGLGVSFYGLKSYAESKKHFLTSYQHAKEAEDLRFQLENLVYMARIATITEDFANANQYLTDAEKLAANTTYNLLQIEIYKAFSNLYNKTLDFRNAATYQNRYITLKDSIYSEELIRNISKVQTRFEERENLATIAAKEDVIQRQRSLTFAIIIIALLTTLLVFVLYRGNRVKKKVNQALSDAKAIIEDQNRQLLNSNYNLDKELKEKNNELEKANEALLRVNDELDNFIYKTSHDIRGPLASLKGMCNVAIMDVVDPLALSYLKKLDITAEKLNTILTRLLIVNQINNSAIGLERIDFVGIVNDVLILEKKKGLPPRLKVKKHIDDSIEYYSDKEFIRIILENLIDNAIKFYNDSTRVEPFVDISITEEQKHVKIRVVDNGIGISEVHPDKIFQMFSRASERSETGGIGLYITKTATEKLGGSVHLKTSPEGFTEFYVLLPFSQSRVFA